VKRGNMKSGSAAAPILWRGQLARRRDCSGSKDFELLGERWCRSEGVPRLSFAHYGVHLLPVTMRFRLVNRPAVNPGMVDAHTALGHQLQVGEAEIFGRLTHNRITEWTRWRPEGMEHT
jgi:hypothetical protein